jgi:hypothetical protein
MPHRDEWSCREKITARAIKLANLSGARKIVPSKTDLVGAALRCYASLAEARHSVFQIQRLVRRVSAQTPILKSDTLTTLRLSVGDYVFA